MLSSRYIKIPCVLVFTIHSVDIKQEITGKFDIHWSRGQHKGKTDELELNSSNFHLEYEANFEIPCTMYVNKHDQSIRAKIMKIVLNRYADSKRSKVYGKLSFDLANYFNPNQTENQYKDSLEMESGRSIPPVIHFEFDIKQQGKAIDNVKVDANDISFIGEPQDKMKTNLDDWDVTEVYDPKKGEAESTEDKSKAKGRKKKKGLFHHHHRPQSTNDIKPESKESKLNQSPLVEGGTNGVENEEKKEANGEKPVVAVASAPVGNNDSSKENEQSGHIHHKKNHSIHKEEGQSTKDKNYEDKAQEEKQENDEEQLDKSGQNSKVPEKDHKDQVKSKKNKEKKIEEDNNQKNDNGDHKGKLVETKHQEPQKEEKKESTFEEESKQQKSVAKEEPDKEKDINQNETELINGSIQKEVAKPENNKQPIDKVKSLQKESPKDTRAKRDEVTHSESEEDIREKKKDAEINIEKDSSQKRMKEAHQKKKKEHERKKHAQPEEKKEIKPEEKAETASDEKQEDELKDKTSIIPAENHEINTEGKEEIQPEEKNEAASGEKADNKPKDEGETTPEKKEEIHPEEKNEAVSEGKQDGKPKDENETTPEEKQEDKPKDEGETTPEKKEQIRPEEKNEAVSDEKQEDELNDKTEITPEENQDDKPKDEDETTPEEKEDIQPKEKNEATSEEKSDDILHVNTPLNEKQEVKEENKEMKPEEKAEANLDEKQEIRPVEKEEINSEEKNEIISNEKQDGRPKDNGNNTATEKQEINPKEKEEAVQPENQEMKPQSEQSLSPITEEPPILSVSHPTVEEDVSKETAKTNSSEYEEEDEDDYSDSSNASSDQQIVQLLSHKWPKSWPEASKLDEKGEFEYPTCIFPIHAAVLHSKALEGTNNTNDIVRTFVFEYGNDHRAFLESQSQPRVFIDFIFEYLIKKDMDNHLFESGKAANFLSKLGNQLQKSLDSFLGPILRKFEVVINRFATGRFEIDPLLADFRELIEGSREHFVFTNGFNMYLLRALVDRIEYRMVTKILSNPMRFMFSNVITWNSFLSAFVTDERIELDFVREVVAVMMMTQNLSMEPTILDDLTKRVKPNQVCYIMKNFRPDVMMPKPIDYTEFARYYNIQEIDSTIKFDELPLRDVEEGGQDIIAENWAKIQLDHESVREFPFLKKYIA